VNTLLDRIKQGLRSLGRTDPSPSNPRQVPPLQRDQTHSSQRLRTELDTTRAPTSLTPASQTPQPPAVSTAARVRKAVLSKARRGALPHGVSPVWGASSAAHQPDFFHDPPGHEPAFALAGAAHLTAQPTESSSRPSHTSPPLQGSLLFPAASESQSSSPGSETTFLDSPSLFDPPTDSSDRLF
jgi:hypothetical protein